MIDMTDLVEFLLARIAEDEAAAQAVPSLGYVADMGVVRFGPTRRHFARWDPARVLAECEAKRRIVERESHWRVPKPGAPVVEVRTWDSDTMLVNGEAMPTAEFNERFTEPAPPSETLKLLALPYAGHPDYREEWRP